MGPVNNATGLSTRAATSSRPNGASGWRSGSSDLSSHEALTYAHLGASRFSHESLNDKAQAIQGRSGQAEPAGRGGFRELMEASTLALSSTSSPLSADQSGRGSGAGDGPQGKATTGTVASFTISMVGNQIQLALNPNSRQG